MYRNEILLSMLKEVPVSLEDHPSDPNKQSEVYSARKQDVELVLYEAMNHSDNSIYACNSPGQLKERIHKFSLICFIM